MGAVSELRAAEHRLTRRMAGWDSFWARRLLPAVEDAAQHTKLWWGIALLLAVTGGRRGRRAAAAGLTGMAVAEVLSNGVGKRLVPRERPPKEWFHADEVEDRPDSSSFPSGHTAAAVAFTAGVSEKWPEAGALCLAVAVAVAVERVHSGAHYPSDVAAGAVIGTVSRALPHAAPAAFRRVRRFFPPPAPALRQWPGRPWRS
ncbi:phosphatase PAP2 family protein [Streptomyces sp. NBC_00539]|uniref:phosphatase PAP2 family protein n=1 Tax=Streptomyces sp. NBC_00539 TaxID=2975770 RepID=UPI002E816147|nr:phosphatase PAP2 family protein [Streptomyces sp. NBC_00539]WUC63749.1 phosphatase PAP2 family protein [Streptomyces sp. NBC_00539]